MRRQVSCWMCGVMVLSGIASIHFVLTSFRSESLAPHKASTDISEDYLGLDGEMTNLPIWCTTCAIVGTSGHLLDYEYGSEIDKNSCIFRLGFSPSRGQERFVGARTTARIVDSASFFPFLKHPTKLVTGPFNSEAWILFDHRAGDISWYHRPFLSSLVQKHDTKFLWMTKKSEAAVYESLKRHSSNTRITRLSAFWFALKTLEDAGCRYLDVYGIPDHQICKRNMDVGVSSLYWDNTSVPLCVHGIDASFTFDRSNPPQASFPIVLERRAFLDWKTKHVTNVRFRAPQWPSCCREMDY